MNVHSKPLAFVDESGFIIPNPTFNTESMKHIKGRFIYSQTELKQAIADMNRRQDERRALADNHYGGDAVVIDAGYETIEDAHEAMAGQRETIPSLTASPTRKRKTEGPSQKLKQPNYAPLPDSLDKPQQGVNLTEEERADLQGIDTAEAVKAMFGH